MTDKLEQFRNIKVPLWARLLGAWRARRHRRAEMKKTVFVCTIKSWIWHKGHQDWVYGWFNLYRNGSGKRWYEYGVNHPSIAGWETYHGVYGTTIKPWLSGEWDDEQMRDCARETHHSPEKQR